MNNQQEAIANAVKIIKKNLPTEEFLKNNKLSEALKSIYKSVDYIKGYFEAPAFLFFSMVSDILQNRFRECVKLFKALTN